MRYEDNLKNPVSERGTGKPDIFVSNHDDINVLVVFKVAQYEKYMNPDAKNFM